ncbi:MAG TPA: hypothetical protein VIL29_04245 [Pseudothermotoga sp.]
MKKIPFLTIMVMLVCATVIAMKITYPEHGKFANGYIDLNQDGLIDFVIETNLWNIERCDGFLKMESGDENLLDVEINLKNIVQINPHRWVHAYPEIWYGAKPWNKLGPTNNGLIDLPRKLSQLQNFSTTVDYVITRKDEKQPYNFAFETWLTKTISRRGVSAGEIEIMIWLAHANLHAAGTKVAEFDVPLILNGIKRNVIFSLFRADMDWEYFAFVAKEPLEKASLTFDWSFFIRKAREFSKIENWQELYFTVVELGTEFGSPGYSTIQLSWSLKKLSFESLTTPMLGD